MATAVAIVTLLFVSTGFVPEQPKNTELTIEPMKEVVQIEDRKSVV